MSFTNLELGALRERTQAGASYANQKDGGGVGSYIEEGGGNDTIARPLHQPRWKRAFGMDRRALAASRMLASCVVLYEGVLGLDWWNVRAFLTDEGVWPRMGVLAQTDERLWQLHMVHGGTCWAYFLNCLFIISGLLLLIGWHTRKASMYCCLYWISVMNRNILIAHSFDKQLVYILMWGALGLPWSDCFSVDAGLAACNGHVAGQPHPLICSVATFGIGVQTAIMYLGTAFHKSSDCWRDGTAAIFAIEVRYISRPVAQIFISHPTTRWLVLVAGQATRPLETMAPLAMLTPWITLKVLGALSLIFFHLGIGMTLRLNDIPFINISALLAFLPAPFWEALQTAWARVAISRPSSQSRTLIHALAEALRRLGHAAPVTSGSKTALIERQDFHSCAPRMMHTFHPQAVLGIWIVVWHVWMWIATVCGGAEGSPCQHKWWTMWHWMHDAGMTLRLDTNWKVFSPRPPFEDWYLVFPATLANNQTVDIFPALHGYRHSRQPFVAVNYDAPQAPAYTIRDERWTKYLENVVKGWTNPTEQHERTTQRRWLGWFLCREWNARHGSGPHRLTNFTMLFFAVDNRVIGRRAFLRRTELWSETC
mmetsp:Transcript_101740/g.286895  ORF Transcript_101740/g.286895 Transcript_101740/m.286895 type:complete len:596 (+) Transcript_101740:84-1871(+)